MAYLLGRAGRVSDALRILLEEVGDVVRAVEFASETQEPSVAKQIALLTLYLYINYTYIHVQYTFIYDILSLHARIHIFNIHTILWIYHDIYCISY